MSAALLPLNVGDLTHFSPSFDRGFTRLPWSSHPKTGAFRWGRPLPRRCRVFTAGPLAGLTVANSYDTLGRRTALEASHDSRITLQSFTYDDASRLQTVTEGDDTASYSYLANSPLVEQIEFKHSGVKQMVTTKQYDRLNRLKSISSTGGASSGSPILSSFDYQYNQANQRVTATLEDGSEWDYAYDSLGQVTSGKKMQPNHAPEPEEAFDYQHDDIGNRKEASGQASSRSSFTANELNQYIQRVDSQPSGKTETMQYDTDGNLIADGSWKYTWDAENRLMAMESGPSITSGQRQRLEFSYDSQGRRITKKVFAWESARSSFSLQPSAFSLFAYDGWNLLAELTSDLRPLISFVWGLDLSGSQQGAGGVGGLLFISDRQAGPGNSHAVAYDANGNVVALVDSQTGKISAQYNHGPFGELIQFTGSMAKSNPFRFSTKYTDDETDLVYYGYRYYQPVSGRWLSRDTIEERGGNNIYNFVCNNPISRIDMFGLWPGEVHQDFLDSWLPIGYNSYNCGNCCKLNVRALLKASSDAADALWNQWGGDANEHAMGNYGPPTQTPEQAQAGYDGFIATKLEIANSLANQARSTASAYTKCNLRKQALAELGRAHHAYADSYSPSHIGFQTWFPLSYYYYDTVAWYGYINVHQSQETMSVYQSMKSGIDFFMYNGELSNILQP